MKPRSMGKTEWSMMNRDARPMNMKKPAISIAFAMDKLYSQFSDGTTL